MLIGLEFTNKISLYELIYNMLGEIKCKKFESNPGHFYCN